MTNRAPQVTKGLQAIAPLIGGTPLLPIPSLSTDKVRIWAKAEWLQLSGSVKARAGFHIIAAALQAGKLQGKTLLDASSGNTALAYAAVTAKLGIALSICLPENASQKRKDLLRALGAELILTSPLEGTDGAQEVAAELASAHPEKYHLGDQYMNPENWRAHYYGTAPEILEQSRGKLTHFIAGLGTTGTFVGTSARLKESNPAIECIALQPDSPMHIMEGWKHLDTAKTPGIYSPKHLDRIELISSDGILDMIQFIARHEGLLLSPSSAANLIGAKQVAETLEQGDLVTILPDDASKYDEILQMIAR